MLVAISPTRPKSYSCSNVGCACTGAVLEFCLHLLGSDGTREAEFTLFGRFARDIISASPRHIILNNVGAGADTTDLAAVATTIMHTPSELAAIVSWSYKFVIHVVANSFQGNWERFNVCAVEQAYPPE